MLLKSTDNNLDIILRHNYILGVEKAARFSEETQAIEHGLSCGPIIYVEGDGSRLNLNIYNNVMLGVIIEHDNTVSISNDKQCVGVCTTVHVASHKFNNSSLKNTDIILNMTPSIYEPIFQFDTEMIDKVTIHHGEETYCWRNSVVCLYR